MLKKLLIADDEALALIGLCSMLTWEEYDIEICGTAHNGVQALEIISSLHPDIVITDIKMPLKSGLEVLEESRQRFGELPVFIILTSYEEFSFAKKAISHGALDYLVKLEMTPQSLAQTISRACARVNEIHSTRDSADTAPPNHGYSLQACRDAFFSHLYFNFFESREQFEVQSQNLNFHFTADCYAVAAFELEDWDNCIQPEQRLALYTGSMQIVKDTCEKFFPCYVTGLDIRHFNLLLCLDAKTVCDHSRLIRIIHTSLSAVHNFWGLRMYCAVGEFVSNAFYARRSYRSACSLIPTLSAEKPVAIDDGSALKQHDYKFKFSEYRSDLTRAFNELDASALQDITDQIISNFSGKPAEYMQAMNAAISLLHLSLSLFPDGETAIEEIFSDLPDNYRSLYLQTTTEQYCKWIIRLRDGLCENIRNRKQCYKEKLLKEVQEYIRNHLDERLLISDVAEFFHFSSSYLSQLFAQYSDCSYVDYVTREKITASKIMMASGDKKIYEIAELLGYNSAFYFSKVFKKATGLTPREYIQNLGN